MKTEMIQQKSLTCTILLIVLLFIALLPVSEAGLRESVSETVLPNGLKVILSDRAAVQTSSSSDKLTMTQDDLGITIDVMSPRWQKKHKIENDNGVVVTNVRPDSPADAGGFKEGDVILAIDRNPIKNVKDFQSSIEQWERTRTIEFSVRRGDKRMYIVVGTNLDQI